MMTLLNKLKSNIVPIMLVVISMLVCYVSYLRKERDSAVLEKNLAVNQLNDYKQKLEQIENSAKETSNKLTDALETLQSNDCGNEPVPDYLLKAEKELLK